MENLVVIGFVEGKNAAEGTLFDVLSNEEISDTNGTRPLCIRRNDTTHDHAIDDTVYTCR